MTAEFVTPESETLLKAGRGICQGWLAVVAGTIGLTFGSEHQDHPDIRGFRAADFRPAALRTPDAERR
jgi:hypothetical protein